MCKSHCTSLELEPEEALVEAVVRIPYFVVEAEAADLWADSISLAGSVGREEP